MRLAVAADLDALVRVAAETFPLACPPHSPAEAVRLHIARELSPAVFTRYLADPTRVLHVDDPGDGAAFDGYAMLVLQEPQDPEVASAIRLHPTSELSKCYVVESAHGTGAAHRLMTAALDAARDRGAAGVWLGTHEDNRRALRFYAKSGFVQVGTKRFRLGDTVEHDAVLERAVGPSDGAGAAR